MIKLTDQQAKEISKAAKKNARKINKITIQMVRYKKDDSDYGFAGIENSIKNLRVEE
jgi:hypothetical protein